MQMSRHILLTPVMVPPRAPKNQIIISCAEDYVSFWTAGKMIWKDEPFPGSEVT